MILRSILLLAVFILSLAFFLTASIYAQTKVVVIPLTETV